MSVTIEIEGVSDETYRKLLERADEAGVPLSVCLLDEFRKLVEVPTIERMQERLEQAAPLELSIYPADVLRAERDTR
jgi:sugar/nucleoside kinase (ribokinase family)